MSNIPEIFPTKSQNISFLLGWRASARWFGCGSDECGVIHQGEKIGKADQKKGG